MLTLTFRPLPPVPARPLDPAAVARALGDQLADLTGATVLASATPVLAPGRPPDYWLRWQTHNTRDRLVLETTWHTPTGLLVVDAHAGAVPHHRFAALWAVCQHAAAAGCPWAALWQEGDDDPLAAALGCQDAAAWAEEEGPQPPGGRRSVGPDLVLEWLRPSPRIMKRLVYFAEDCRIDWEALIVEDLMRATAATYLELRQGRNTVALARVLRDCHLPGMEGYHPRSRTPAVTYTIESIEVHPDHQGRGHGARLVQAVQELRRPVRTLDTYRRAEKFWQHMGFVHDPRRSSREDSNIFQWSPATGAPLQSRHGGAE